MASFVNSFALLEGDATAAPAPSGKKKKSKKAKKPASATSPPAQENGTVAHVHEEQSADDEGFQLAGKSSRRTSTSSTKPPSTVASPKSRSVAEGITDLESAASQVPVKDSADRVAVWKSWKQQVTNTLLTTLHLTALLMCDIHLQCTDVDSEALTEGQSQYHFKQVSCKFKPCS